MPIQVSWGNPEKTIVHSVFSEEWTLEEAHNMIDDMHKLTSSVDYTVHSILDFTTSKTSPTRILSMGQHIEKRKVPNTGVAVIVKANNFIKAIAQLVTKMFVRNTNTYFADSLEEAYQIIQKYEQSSTKS